METRACIFRTFEHSNKQRVCSGLCDCFEQDNTCSCGRDAGVNPAGYLTPGDACPAAMDDSVQADVWRTDSGMTLGRLSNGRGFAVLPDSPLWQGQWRGDILDLYGHDENGFAVSLNVLGEKRAFGIYLIFITDKP